MGPTLHKFGLIKSLNFEYEMVTLDKYHKHRRSKRCVSCTFSKETKMGTTYKCSSQYQQVTTI